MQFNAELLCREPKRNAEAKFCVVSHAFLLYKSIIAKKSKCIILYNPSMVHLDPVQYQQEAPGRYPYTCIARFPDRINNHTWTSRMTDLCAKSQSHSDAQSGANLHRYLGHSSAHRHMYCLGLRPCINSTAHFFSDMKAKCCIAAYTPSPESSW